MTLQDYRDDPERIKFAKTIGDLEMARDLVKNHQGQHVACLSCAVVAVYFDVELVVTERQEIYDQDA